MTPMPSNHDKTRRFVDLLTKNERRIYGYIVTLTGNFADADDVYQEVSVLLWDEFDKYEPGSDFGAWACTIARYRVLALRERNSRSKVVFCSHVLQKLEKALSDRSNDLDRRSAALGECLKELSPVNRQLMKRVYEGSQTIAQVAQAMGRPVEATYKTMQRLRRFLSDCIRQRLMKEAHDG